MIFDRTPIQSFAAKAMILCLFGLCSAVAENSNQPALRTALIPLSNYTASNTGLELVTKELRAQLSGQGYELADADSLRSQMRRQRLRLVGEVDSTSVVQIAADTHIDMLITGALDLFLDEDNPEVGVCLRVYDCHEKRIIWMDCEFAAGEDQAGLFGIGRITKVDELAREVVERLVDRMPSGSSRESLKQPAPTKSESQLASAGRMAVVAFDNSTSFPNADAVVTDLLRLELWRRGYNLLESGELSRLQSRLNVMILGGISDSALTVVREEFGVNAVVTGSVGAFSPSPNTQGDNVPNLEFSIRIIDPSSGEIVRSATAEHDGSEWETVFGMGRINSIGKLTERSLRITWTTLVDGWAGPTASVAAKSDSSGDTNARE